MIFPEIAKIASEIKEDVEKNGYSAYRNPYDVYEQIIYMFFKIAKDKGIEERSTEWYDLLNEHEDLAHDIGDLFWSM